MSEKISGLSCSHVAKSWAPQITGLQVIDVLRGIEV